jgi:hypothetical protein
LRWLRNEVLLAKRSDRQRDYSPARPKAVDLYALPPHDLGPVRDRGTDGEE